jgi:glycosyltransferase involved in cell wall biosynthesis
VFADFDHELNCSIFNVFNPVKAINKLEGNKADKIHFTKFVENNEETQKLCSEADIIIIERNFFSDVTVMAQYWKTRGKTVIGIWDDSYDHMDRRNPTYEFWEHGEVSFKDQEGKIQKGRMYPNPLTQFRWTLRIMKGAQVVSKALAEDWSPYVKTYHINNYLDMDRYQAAKPLIKHDGYIFVGWCGSLSHFSSHQDSGALRALRKIVKNFPKVRVLIGGDKRVFDALDIPSSKKLFQPYVPDEYYSGLLKSFDIGIAPLAGEYDKRRSWLKVLEYQVMKVPWVASDYPTYEELFPYGKPTKNTWRDWEEAIADVLQNYEERKYFAETTAYDFAKNQSIDLNIGKTLELYNRIIKEPYLDEW